MNKSQFIIGLALLALIAACAALEGRQSQISSSADSGKAPAFDAQDLDTTCKPCDDFFQFATGGWRKRNPIGPAYASWARFSELAEKNQNVLRGILETAAASRLSASKTPSAELESPDQKLGDFYAACMDEKAIERQGAKPLQSEFARIETLHSVSELPAEIAHLHSRGVRVLFGFGAGQDDKNSDQFIAQAMQGGLGLPDRDYYLNQDDRSQRLREQYQEHIARMLRLNGEKPEQARTSARRVLAIETKLAEASKTRVERRDPQSNYNKISIADLGDLTPSFSWQVYLREIGFPEIGEINVGQPDFFRSLNLQLQSIPVAEWKTYLRWHLLSTAAPALSSRFVNENFNFYNRTLTGTKELLPRWRRCVTSTDRNLGEALGQKFVAMRFPPEAKARAESMVHNLTAALRADLETVPWMSETTRQEALAKLAAVSLKIGYPEKWRDYSNYHVLPGPYIENLWRGSNFELHRNLGKIGKPLDRTEWSMTPPTVNAYYNASMNEIVFPAGILQPPFFDPEADDALNYGAIGAVIGHEMTHGFDDQGSQYDAKGNLREWWTSEDRKAFQARAECVEKQFSSFVVDGDVHENGKLVLGESIADLGGLNIARAALERALSAKNPPETIEGFTQAQRFFLGYARIWGTNARLEYERMMAVTDPHPLPRFRVNGSVSNMPEFTAAFACPAGSPMARSVETRCKIW
jgi:putative endopeptidase